MLAVAGVALVCMRRRSASAWAIWFVWAVASLPLLPLLSYAWPAGAGSHLGPTCANHPARPACSLHPPVDPVPQFHQPLPPIESALPSTPSLPHQILPLQTVAGRCCRGANFKSLPQRILPRNASQWIGPAPDCSHGWPIFSRRRLRLLLRIEPASLLERSARRETPRPPGSICPANCLTTASASTAASPC